MLEQPGIFDGSGNAAGDQREDVLLIAREIIDLAAFDVEDADYAAAHNQRNGQFRSDGVERVQIARVLANVGDADRLARGRGRTDDSLGHGNSPVLHHLRAMTDGKAKIHLVGSLFGQHDREDFIIDQPLDLRRSACEHFVQIQRGVNFLANLGENRESLRRKIQLRIEACRFHFSVDGAPRPPPR